MILLAALLAPFPTLAQQRYSAKGLVLAVDKQHRTMTVSCEDIPGYMDAMVMPMEVRDAGELDGLARGTLIDFSFVADKEHPYAENVRIRNFDSLELDPLSARRLRLLDGAIDQSLSLDLLKVGQPVPDFSLTDQNREHVTRSQFGGKVVAITFVYTRCPFPNFCFRLTNNFARLQKRFAKEMGRNLILLTISLDPVHDQPETLAEYARTWNIDAKGWHLLTGPPAEVHKFCERFGVAFFPDEGQLIHSLHTLIIDRQGKLAVNLEGNEFTAEELGDLVQSVLKGGASNPSGL
ncbi:MAG TPA: SCO family protein [Candidatus Methylomirabilis sp.]|nr:SCO family protein [Candidatus Methylomirabilis sp.]